MFAVLAAVTSTGLLIFVNRVSYSQFGRLLKHINLKPDVIEKKC